MTAPIVHPPWCDVAACGVALVLGHPTGAHHSRAVVVEARTGNQVEVKLCLWQIHGREVHVLVDWNRPHDVPVDGILFDLDEAKVVGRVLRDLAAMAAREETR